MDDSKHWLSLCSYPKKYIHPITMRLFEKVSKYIICCHFIGNLGIYLWSNGNWALSIPSIDLVHFFQKWSPSLWLSIGKTIYSKGWSCIETFLYVFCSSVEWQFSFMQNICDIRNSVRLTLNRKDNCSTLHNQQILRVSRPHKMESLVTICFYVNF